jgi:hypothetical protein
MRFNASDEFKDMLFEQYKVANCGEIIVVRTVQLMKNMSDASKNIFRVYHIRIMAQKMFPTIRNLQIYVHVYRPRHCCGD